jgi:hypothetical protein
MHAALEQWLRQWHSSRHSTALLHQQTTQQNFQTSYATVLTTNLLAAISCRVQHDGFEDNELPGLSARSQE